MLEIVLATGNPGKVREIRRILGEQVRWLTREDLAVWPEVAEEHLSFRENALEKAMALARATGKAALADDSGLEVDALQGEPGARSARFAGPKATDRDNYELLLARLKGIPAPERRARFRCAAVLASPEGLVAEGQGTLEGSIASQPSGEHGFGYDPVFIPAGHPKTVAELGPEEKNRISHRAAALAQLRPAILQLAASAGEKADS